MLNQWETTDVANRRRTRKQYQSETAKTRMTRRQHRRNKGERSGPASGRGVSLPERCDRVRRLSAEDDRDCGGRNEAKLQGGKGDGGPGRGA